MHHKPQTTNSVANTPTPAEVSVIGKANSITESLNGLPDRVMLRAEVELAVGHKKSWIYDAVKRGDQVVTSGGIVGKVTKVEDKMVEVEIASGVKVRVIKSTLADIDSGTAKPAND